MNELCFLCVPQVDILGKKEKCIKMSETGATLTTNSTSDKLAALSKEAESLKTKLEEERHKLNDISRKNRFSLVLVLKT